MLISILIPPGGGTWVEDSKGRVLVSRSDDGQFKTVNQTIGAENNVLTVNNLPAHTHTYNTPKQYTEQHILTLEQIPSHSHTMKTTNAGSKIDGYFMTGGYDLKSQILTIMPSGGGKGHGHEIKTNSASTSSIGSSSIINNVQPSKVCIRWHRTA